MNHNGGSDNNTMRAHIGQQNLIIGNLLTYILAAYVKSKCTFKKSICWVYRLNKQTKVVAPIGQQKFFVWIVGPPPGFNKATCLTKWA